MKLGYGIISSGHTGTGKTTSVKEVIKKVNSSSNYIFDVNAEYLEFNNKAKNCNDFEQFLDLVENVERSVIVFEESTIFLSKSSNLKKIRSLMVRKRHKKNIVIFNFHSVRSVSNFIIDLSDFYILHYTTDKPEYIYISILKIVLNLYMLIILFSMVKKQIDLLKK